MTLQINLLALRIWGNTTATTVDLMVPIFFSSICFVCLFYSYKMDIFSTVVSGSKKFEIEIINGKMYKHFPNVCLSVYMSSLMKTLNIKILIVTIKYRLCLTLDLFVQWADRLYGAYFKTTLLFIKRWMGMGMGMLYQDVCVLVGGIYFWIVHIWG